MGSPGGPTSGVPSCLPLSLPRAQPVLVHRRGVEDIKGRRVCSFSPEHITTDSVTEDKGSLLARGLGAQSPQIKESLELVPSGGSEGEPGGASPWASGGCWKSSSLPGSQRHQFKLCLRLQQGFPSVCHIVLSFLLQGRSHWARLSRMTSAGDPSLHCTCKGL